MKVELSAYVPVVQPHSSSSPIRMFTRVCENGQVEFTADSLAEIVIGADSDGDIVLEQIRRYSIITGKTAVMLRPAKNATDHEFSRVLACLLSVGSGWREI